MYAWEDLSLANVSHASVAALPRSAAIAVCAACNPAGLDTLFKRATRHATFARMSSAHASSQLSPGALAHTHAERGAPMQCVEFAGVARPHAGQLAHALASDVWPAFVPWRLARHPPGHASAADVLPPTVPYRPLAHSTQLAELLLAFRHVPGGHGLDARRQRCVVGSHTMSAPQSAALNGHIAAGLSPLAVQQQSRLYELDVGRVSHEDVPELRR